MALIKPLIALLFAVILIVESFQERKFTSIYKLIDEGSTVFLTNHYKIEIIAVSVSLSLIIIMLCKKNLQLQKIPKTQWTRKLSAQEFEEHKNSETYKAIEQLLRDPEYQKYLQKKEKVTSDEIESNKYYNEIVFSDED